MGEEMEDEEDEEEIGDGLRVETSATYEEAPVNM